MTPQQTLDRLDALIAERSILQHPFYQAWEAGTLDRDQLATYARRYYPHVDAFPDYLRTAIAGTNDAVIREELEDNLHEELHVPAPHDALWLDFAAGLGLDRGSVRRAEAAPATRRTVAAFDRLAVRSTAAALTALYCYEAQQPEVSATKADGLRTRYGITDEQTLAYFTVHQEADVRHREGERMALARCLEAGATEDEVMAAAEEALDAYWTLLDGVAAEIGLPEAAC